MTSAMPWCVARISGRFVGTLTTRTSLSLTSTVNPSGSRSPAISASWNCVPRRPLTLESGTSSETLSTGVAGIMIFEGATTSPGDECPRISAKRSIALSSIPGSVPFWNRAAASDRNAKRRLVLVIVMGSNRAASSNTDDVSPLISEDSPPMIPAIPTMLSFASQITRSCPVSPRLRPSTPSSRVTPSRVTNDSPVVAVLTLNPLPSILSRS